MNNSNLIQEDEIDLRELFSIIWTRKLFILIFTFIVTLSSVFYALSKPNVYESKAIFILNDIEKQNIIPKDLEGFVNLSIGKQVGIDNTYRELLNSFNFMQKFIFEYSLYETFFDTKNFIYPFGLDLSNDKIETKIINQNELTMDEQSLLFGIFKSISSNLNISRDKKTNLIVFKYKGSDRFINKRVLDGFLEYAGKYLKNEEIQLIEDKISSFNQEISKTRSIELKNRMLELSSTLYKRKVFLQTENFSGLKPVVMPEVPFIGDKIAPKRSLIVVVAFVTGFILSIFVVFLLNFISKNKEENL